MNPFYGGNSIPGWMSPAELQCLYEFAADMDSVVEVGSWAGRSTHAILSSCKGQVTAVDEWDQEVMKAWGDARTARQMFLDNFRAFPNLKVLEMSSIEAAKLFKPKSVDMVFLDARHEYEYVKQDIDIWLPKTRKLICGHDFSPNWPGVGQAVYQVFGGSYQFTESIWFVRLG